MSLQVSATYENGVLKLDEPLPLKENERVTVTVRPSMSRMRQTAGLLHWTGAPDVLRHIAEDDE